MKIGGPNFGPKKAGWALFGPIRLFGFSGVFCNLFFLKIIHDLVFGPDVFCALPLQKWLDWMKFSNDMISILIFIV